MFEIIATVIVLLGLIAYGIVFIMAAHEIHEAQREYYDYIKNRKHYNLEDFYSGNSQKHK